MITNINKFKLINEKFVNLWTRDSMKDYINIIYDMLVKIYEPIGGFLTANSADMLLSKCDLIKIIKRKEIISAFCCYKKTIHGRKVICGGSDGSDRGKKDLYSIMIDDINQKNRNSYSEVSDKIENIYLKNNATMIPNYLVKNIINKDITLDEDGFHYFRNIKGQNKRKLLIGNIFNVNNF